MNDQNFNQSSYTPPVNDYDYNNQAHPEPRLNLKAALGSGMFLALSILVTIMLALTFFNTGSISIISLLIMIGMWMCYSSANSENSSLSGGLKLISGSLLATVIVNWIGAAFVALGGIVLTLLGILLPSSALAGTNDLIQDTTAKILRTLEQELNIDSRSLQELFDAIADIDWEELLPILSLVFGIVLILGAVVAMILNIVFYKRLHSFAKSLCVCDNDASALPRYANSSATWLLVIAILYAISLLSTASAFGIFGFLGFLMLFAGSILECIILVFAYVFIKKYIVAPTKQ